MDRQAALPWIPVPALALVTMLVVALVVAGCAATPQKNVQYQHAQTVIQDAAADPDIAQYSPAQLSRARQELNLAQAAGERDQVDQHSYLAIRYVDLARAQAQEAAARAVVAQGEQQRTQIQLQARTAEARQARQQTEAAQARAAAATGEAAQARGESQQLQRQSQQLQQQLQQLQAKQTDRGLVVTLSDVLFDTGKSDLKSGAFRALGRIVDFLMQHPERQVEVDGFTDSVGGDSYNQQLSQRRADAVRDALADRGIAASRVQARGYGKSFPVASNQTSAGRQLNRRVEVVISTGAGPVPSREPGG